MNEMKISSLTIRNGLLIILLVSYPYTEWFKKRQEEIYCHATSYIYNNNMSQALKMNILLHINRNDNYFDINMSLINTIDNTRSKEIQRIINLSFDRDGDTYTFFSEPGAQNFIPSTIRNTLNDFIPDFFLVPYRGIKLRMIRSSENYIILIDRFPLFYCIKNESIS